MPDNKQPSHPPKRSINARYLMLALAVGLSMLLLFRATQPKRSVEAYCKVYSQEKARLSAMSNRSNPYPSGVFNVSVTDASQIAMSFSKLDRVAPKEIESEVSSLQKLYQDMHDNPSHIISNGINGSSLDDSLKSWTMNNCHAASLTTLRGAQ